MSRVYVAAHNILSPLGFSSEENFARTRRGESGIRAVNDATLHPKPFFAAQVDSAKLNDAFSSIDEASKFTRIEKFAMLSVNDALSRSVVKLNDASTLFILSTTKGNIDLLEANADANHLNDKLPLHNTAKLITRFFENENEPLVVSHACISGVLALVIAKRMLQKGYYQHAVICGADVLSKFVVSGFHALNAVSSEVCKPYDRHRTGINLGEGAATIVLTTDANLLREQTVAELKGGSCSNDANHISGPSRTGDELAQTVNEAINESKVMKNDIGFVNAHGTATVFNDEMESKAFAQSGFGQTPLNSLKAHFGHTLGAAGVIESVMSIQAMMYNEILASTNYSEHGVSEALNICRTTTTHDINHLLKTASGFGGCNAAAVFSKTKVD